jgi:hypothetical protein
MKMFTQEKIEVTKRIENGQTFFTKSKKEAIEITKKQSYFYDVFDKDGNHIGYGIPK